MNLLYLSNLELRQICYFVAVAAAGNNFSKAAENLPRIKRKCESPVSLDQG
jgi:hypothetical protein